MLSQGQNGGYGLSAADVAAVMNGNGNNWGNDGGWWLLLLLFALGGGGWGNFGFGGFGGLGAGMMGMGMMDNVMLWPYLMTQNIGNQMQSGFDGVSMNGRIDSLSSQMQDGFNDIQQNGKLDGIQSSITNGFQNAEVSSCNRAMAQQAQNYQQTIDSMQNTFNAERALDNRLDSLDMSLQKCCCDNELRTESLRATVLAENCEDRNQALLNTRDINDNVNNKFQAVSDKIAALDSKMTAQNYEAQIRALQEQLSQQRDTAQWDRFAASQANQNALFAANQLQQTQDIENFVRPPINPSYPVPNPYGFSWNPYYGYGSGGCGCNGNNFVNGGFYG